MNPTRMKKLLVGTALIALSVVGASCRGGISDKPPIHPVLDMDFQSKVKAQMASPKVMHHGEEVPLFADGRGMRPPVAGTVARGSLGMEELRRFATDSNGNGTIEDGEYRTDNPVALTAENLARGRERFEIYCSVCHTKLGGIDEGEVSTRGLVLQRGEVTSPNAFNYKLPNLGSDERLQNAADGYLYNVVANGAGTMPGYAHQIPVEDRWRIVHWLRVLQNRFQ